MPPSSGVERYAFCSKKKSVHFDRHKARLVKELEEEVDREPYTLFFEPKHGKPLDVFTIHAVPTAKAPIKEIRALTFSSALGDTPRAIVAGDFNMPPKETDPLFAAVGYQGHIAELTSLRKKVTGAQYLSRQYDNIYTKGVEVCTSGAVDFVKKSFSPVNDESLLRALKISDHLPVFVTFK